MTKEELEKEAEEYTNTHDTLVMGCEENLDCTKFMQQAYVDSAEPREKRIAELEEKNKQLTDQLCNVANNLLDSWCRNEDDYCPHLAKLEKENAELRKKNLSLQDTVDMQMYTNKANKEMAEIQLTKAKELLKKWVELYRPKLEGYPITPIQEETENFLKDSEVEK